MEFDIFIPSLSIAFEYQGEQHYSEVECMITTDIALRDKEKQDVCKEAGVTLIEIPYWWNFSRDSLAATIYTVRPDLPIFEDSKFQTSWQPIPKILPENKLKKRIH